MHVNHVTIETMKRISDYFIESTMKRKAIEDRSSTPRSSSINPAGTSVPNNNSGLELQNTTRDSGSSTSVFEVNDSFWPSCWTVEQKNEFVKKNNWLFFHEGKLGCSVCKNVGCLGAEKTMGMRIAKEWINCEITYYGENRKQQLTSLRKKIFDHRESAGHKAAVKITEEGKKEKLKTICLKSREKEITSKIFRTAYKVAKKNQSFNDFEAEIDLQELNGIDMGRILHSANACINIINHIGNEMRTTLIRKIIDSKSEISLILESTIVNQKSVLVVHIRTYIEDIDMQEPVNLFIGLIELEDVTATGIYRSFMSQIDSLGLTEEFLKENLISLISDGGGVSTLFKAKFPAIVLWHFASHRLELLVHKVVKEVVTPERSSLSLQTITSLLFIKIVGPPLTAFDPTKYVKTWLLQGHHSALGIKSKTRKRTEEVGDMSKIWKLL